MSAPVDDEIDVGRDPRGRAPWHDWSPGRRKAGAIAAVVVVLAAAALWFALRERQQPASAPPEVAVTAPGADTVVDLEPDLTKCPTGAQCRYGAEVDEADEAAFRSAFDSAGFIGRQTVADTVTGEVYWQVIRFSTGTLVTVTLSQQPVTQLVGLPVVDDTADRTDVAKGSVSLTAVRDGYLMTAAVAGLPGQALPVRAAQEWVRAVPAPVG